MQRVYDKKGAHTLHEATTAEDFLARFEKTTGRELLPFLDRLVAPEHVSAVILGGSIPLGIGTHASDIDVLVLIDSPAAIHRPEDIVYFGEYPATETQLAAANIVALLAHVEVDFMFVLDPRLRELSDRIKRRGAALTLDQIRLTSRIKTGWLLARGPRFDEGYRGVLDDNSLEVHCAVSYFVTALKTLEDARAALDDNLPLALHLGRVAVERSLEAYFASRGYAFLGSKWLRFLERLRERETESTTFTTAAALALPAMFPALTNDRAAAERHLRDVAEAMRAIKRAIELDPTFKLALKMSAHIFEP